MFFLDTEEALDIAPAPIQAGKLLHPRRPGVKPTWPVVVSGGMPPGLFDYWILQQQREATDLTHTSVFGGLINAPTFSSDAGGQHHAIDRAASQIVRQAATGVCNDKDDHSFLFAVRISSVNTGNYVVGGEFNSGSANKLFVLRKEGVFLGYGIRYSEFAGSLQYARLSSNPNDDNLHVIAFGVTNNTQWICMDGRDYQTNDLTAYKAANTNNVITDRYSFGAGDRNSPFEHSTVKIYAAARFSRGLSATEALNLTKDPYQFLRPKLDVLPLQSRNVPGGFSLPTSVTRPRRPGQKPTWPVEVDWSHPDVKGLRGCYIFSNAVDLSRETKSPINSSLSNKLHGDCFIQSGNLFLGGDQDALEINSTPSYTDEITIIAKVKSVNAGALQGIYVADNGSVHRCFQFRLFGSAVQFISFVGGSTGVATGSTTIASNEFYTLAATHKNAASNNVKVYVDGVEDGVATKPGALDADPAVKLIGGQSEVGALTTITSISQIRSSFDGEIEFIYQWDRVLSSDEILRISRDPYQFLIPKL